MCRLTVRDYDSRRRYLYEEAVGGGIDGRRKRSQVEAFVGVYVSGKICLLEEVFAEGSFRRNICLWRDTFVGRKVRKKVRKKTRRSAGTVAVEVVFAVSEFRLPFEARDTKLTIVDHEVPAHMNASA
jgi:hypothetical protein